KEQLDIVHTSGQHLLSLINDIIDISKIEAGKIAIYMEDLNLKDVVNEALSIIIPQINDKKLTLTVDAPDITMNTDYRRLLQCIINLLSNATKFTEKGNIELTTETINNRVDISISDTGIGIKDDDLPKLFTAFTRLESHLTTKTPGTGLGLYLTQKLIEEVLGGTIDVKSTYGKGSTFTMHIPIKQEEKT
ncbi:MAG: HAMP domain-containing histidine kinase, partial [Methanosarcinales archaeon]|nr:HAMP domain-containing histidine kinase [Methanosarcinales archaeon]